jgi:hypothetical protein
MVRYDPYQTRTTLALTASIAQNRLTQRFNHGFAHCPRTDLGHACRHNVTGA